MPRKPTLITHEFPYHITGRTNNKEWFDLPMNDCWNLFARQLQLASARFNFQIHGFVLMNNHYHMVGTASKDFPLPKVMEWFQVSVTREFNSRAGRINHLFGRRYSWSLIKKEGYYFHAMKYLYRNPVEAGVVAKVEDYKFSTFRQEKVPLTVPITGIATFIPHESTDQLKVFNKAYEKDALAIIRKALRKGEFKFPRRMSLREKEGLEIDG